ncbi:hypothetical protein jhhlp_003928 [Lomentospora prolificans]|uniref:Ras family protein n=1 Tax=Lomentospora prolificans TaxID=41688 RepID=A0A2N3NA59_9PEZI|nr:hypothetical protein jhhlp_003928 [Lomentospora prolificans]
MGREENRRARILLLGAPGVGKNCLESRFTTTTFPPPYNPALTLSSLRLFTLTPKGSQPPTPSIPSTPPLDLSLEISFDQNGFNGADTQHPSTGSSVYSGESIPGVVTVPGPVGAASSPRSESRENTKTCAECVRAANTFMVEVINYPTLQLAKERANVLSMGDYDAVLLVYDVGSRETFDILPILHGEVSLMGRSNGRGTSRKSQTPSQKDEPIIALAGNKADLDSARAPLDLSLSRSGEKKRDMQTSEHEASSLASPAQVDPVRSPSSLSMSMREFVADGRRSAMSMETSITRSPSKLLRRQSSQSVRLSRKSSTPRMSRRASERELADMWLKAGSANQETSPLGNVDETTQVENHSSASVRREVQTAEGEALARQLQIRIPFFETSAKTGDNVEELFEAILREVLGSKGLEVRDAADYRGSKPCKRHSAMDSKFSSTVNSPTDPVPESRLSTRPGQSRQATRSSGEWPSAFVSERSSEAEEPVINLPPPPTSPKPKKEGVLRRMGSIFGKKKQMPRTSA